MHKRKWPNTNLLSFQSTYLDMPGTILANCIATLPFQYGRMVFCVSTPMRILLIHARSLTPPPAALCRALPRYRREAVPPNNLCLTHYKFGGSADRLALPMGDGRRVQLCLIDNKMLLTKLR